MKRNVKLLLTVLSIVLSIDTWAQLPTAPEIAKQMKVGWNMGNALEAICGETAWGSAVTTQGLIDSVKCAGFNTVRLPVAWFCHSDTVTSQIDAEWIARVKEVVDYCVKDSLYVILNMHWDKGWLENRINKANQAQVNERLHIYWTQIATYFKDYDEHLLFAGANEPNAKDAEAVSVLMTYYQTFVDAVRATGGNNASRTLIVQGPETDVEKTLNLFNDLPKDPIKDRMMVEVHYYTPFQFCLLEKDASWGKIFFFWGKGYKSKKNTERNASWGEEEHIDKFYGLMKNKFADKDIPVILGEFAARKRTMANTKEQKLHDASVEYFYKYVVKSAINNGMIPFCWDVNMGLFDRSNGKVLDRGVLDAIMQGANEATGIY